MEQSLYHHGIKGQKWGIRRFQNKDGSLTVKGKKRSVSKWQEKQGDITADLLQKNHERKARKAENKAIRKEANSQSYGKSIKKTIGRDAGIFALSIGSAVVAKSKGREDISNVIINAGHLATTASNVYGLADIGRVFAKRNGFI